MSKKPRADARHRREPRPKPESSRDFIPYHPLPSADLRFVQECPYVPLPTRVFSNVSMERNVTPGYSNYYKTSIDVPRQDRRNTSGIPATKNNFEEENPPVIFIEETFVNRPLDHRPQYIAPNIAIQTQPSFSANRAFSDAQGASTFEPCPVPIFSSHFDEPVLPPSSRTEIYSQERNFRSRLFVEEADKRTPHGIQELNFGENSRTSRYHTSLIPKPEFSTQNFPQEENGVPQINPQFINPNLQAVHFSSEIRPLTNSHPLVVHCPLPNLFNYETPFQNIVYIYPENQYQQMHLVQAGREPTQRMNEPLIYHPRTSLQTRYQETYVKRISANPTEKEANPPLLIKDIIDDGDDSSNDESEEILWTFDHLRSQEYHAFNPRKIQNHHENKSVSITPTTESQNYLKMLDTFLTERYHSKSVPVIQDHLNEDVTKDIIPGTPSLAMAGSSRDEHRRCNHHPIHVRPSSQFGKRQTTRRGAPNHEMTPRPFHIRENLPPHFESSSRESF